MMTFLIEAGVGGAGVSIVVGALLQGFFGEGFFAIQVAVTLCAICLAPLLQRLGRHVPRVLSYVFVISVTCVFVLPVGGAVLKNLFTGHRRPGAGPFDAVWRVFAIVLLWILFAKVNEEYIRPALRKVPFFSGPVNSNSVNAQVARMALSKREKALEAIKSRLVPVVARRKRAEKVVEEKGAELENARSQVAKTQKLLDKKQARFDTAKEDGAADIEDIEEERDLLAGMAENAQNYLSSLQTQIESAKSDIKECKEMGAKMQEEWTVARHINNHTGFYR